MLNKYRVRQILTPLIGSFGVLCAGSTYVWVNTAQETLKSNQSPVVMSEEQLSWFVAVVEVGDLLATLPSGFMADHVGRKTILLITGPLIIITWILVQTTASYIVMLMSRVLQGLAVGCIFTVTPMYLAEVSDKTVRGMAGTLVQCMWYAGIIYQYSVGPYLSLRAGINIVCIAPALVFTLLLAFCPETPRYYTIRSKPEKAKNRFDWIFGEKGDISQLDNILIKDASSKDQSKEESFAKVLVQFFKKRKPIKSLFLVSVIAVTNVIGVIPVVSYSSATFEKIVGVNSNKFNILMGCLSLITALVTAGSVDKLGRRPLLLFSMVACTFILSLGGVLYLTTTGTILPALCIAFYPPLSSLGPGTLSYALMAELFSDKYRGVGSSMVTLIAAIATFIGLKFYNIIESSFGLQVNLFSLGFITFSCAIIIYKYLPETKGKTFDEIQNLL